MTLYEELDVIEALQTEGLPSEMIDTVVHMENHPEEWVGPFNSVAEVQAWVEADDETD